MVGNKKRWKAKKRFCRYDFGFKIDGNNIHPWVNHSDLREFSTSFTNLLNLYADMGKPVVETLVLSIRGGADFFHAILSKELMV